MTREEAIEFLGQYVGNDCYTDKCQEAHRMAISALRPVSREQVEKTRGEWVVKHDGYNEITITECSKCEDETVYEFFFEEADANFCPRCGAPMTDEAVDMVMERLEEATKT